MDAVKSFEINTFKKERNSVEPAKNRYSEKKKLEFKDNNLK